MPRARNIKYSFFQNDELGELAPLDRLAFIGMWTVADFRGCLELKPKRLKVQLLPYDECDFEIIAINLDKSGLIRIYSVQGQRYIKILNFEKHQNPHKNEREAGSDIPDLPENYINNNDLENIQINRDKDGTAPADSLILIPDLLIPDKKLLSEKKPSDDFTQFWKAYPKKTGKGAALKAWNKAKPPIDSVLKALAWQRTSKQWLDGFIVNPATYINQTRWEDEPEAKLGGGASQVIYQSQPIQRDITKIAENMKRIKAVL